MRKNEVRTRKGKIDEGEMKTRENIWKRDGTKLKRKKGGGSWRRKWWQREIG